MTTRIDESLALPVLGYPDPFLVGPTEFHSLIHCHTASAQTAASRIWPTASMAFGFLFGITETRTYAGAIWVNGAAVSGNVDVGIYDLAGNRKTSCGSTAQSGISAVQKQGFTASVTLTPGFYYLLMVIDNITGTVWSSTTTLYNNLTGATKQVASAFVLPATVTYAEPTGTTVTPTVAVYESGISSWI